MGQFLGDEIWARFLWDFGMQPNSPVSRLMLLLPNCVSQFTI